MGVKEQTKFNLKEAFWSIYKEKPINKISIKEITNHAGYNRGTFYNYYNDVYDILHEIKQEFVPSEELISTILQRFQKNDLNHFSEKEKEQARYEMEQSYGEDMNERIMVLLGPKGDPDFIYEYKKEARDRVMKQVKNLDEKAQVKLEYIVEFLISGSIHTWMLWRDNHMNISENELNGLFNELAKNGFEKVLVDILNRTK
ncbi:TetR/AcrR family transcriptional regulator [Virgibacillus sp. NKC19-3]|uniref:TetR/AcrR family transcriptional regulator n=1 Tax=Virgibacillus saliphilus TaxID=2831674 RepID=UPI001C9B6B92|nr:TetR/AcrR family transcriptional regulator [Virgibacillus sp. NKC19-3]MBY7142581.1 TetR/AcrR family transcriptional regulator [Virgibacillus sp. NKC19-3]